MAKEIYIEKWCKNNTATWGRKKEHSRQKICKHIIDFPLLELSKLWLTVEIKIIILSSWFLISKVNI
jgi:hypothetical protein